MKEELLGACMHGHTLKSELHSRLWVSFLGSVMANWSVDFCSTCACQNWKRFLLVTGSWKGCLSHDSEPYQVRKAHAHATCAHAGPYIVLNFSSVSFLLMSHISYNYDPNGSTTDHHLTGYHSLNQDLSETKIEWTCGSNSLSYVLPLTSTCLIYLFKATPHMCHRPSA